MKDQRTDAELNRIIAEWMGWTVWECKKRDYVLQYPYKPGSDPISSWRLENREEAKKKHTQIPWNKVDPNKWAGDVPYFCTDLNAIHEAVSKLSRNDYDNDRGFTWHLARVVHGYDANAEKVGFDFYEMQEATARQRAEALVAVIESK